MRPALPPAVHVASVLLGMSCSVGCGESSAAGTRSSVDAGTAPMDAPTRPVFEADLEHSFPPVDVASGEERDGMCLSWTLDNDEELFVHTVRSTNEGGYHHSNWMFVPDTDFPGEDGVWPCSERGFDQILAGLNGGVFFAQSTQALEDEQAFPEGAAFRVPAHARIIGNVHLLNVADDALSSSLSFEVDTLPEPEVEILLAPMSVTNTALEIPPQAQSEFTMSCDIGAAYAQRLGHAPDFDIHYVLPHFHSLGTDLRLTLRGGDNDGAVAFEVDGSYGDSLGQRLTHR